MLRTAPAEVRLSNDERDRRGQEDSHDDIEDSQPSMFIQRVLHGGAERQPEEAARQRGEKKEAPESGRLNEGTARSGAEKRARGARTHEPGFRIDPLEDGGAHESDRFRPRARCDAARGGRDLPGQPEEDCGTTPVEGLDHNRIVEDEAPETERDEKHHEPHTRDDTEQTRQASPDAGLRAGRGQHDVAGARGHRGDEGEQNERRDLLRRRRLPPRSEGPFRGLAGVCK